jgi:hypothetical protein
MKHKFSFAFGHAVISSQKLDQPFSHIFIQIHVHITKWYTKKTVTVLLKY